MKDVISRRIHLYQCHELNEPIEKRGQLVKLQCPAGPSRSKFWTHWTLPVSRLSRVSWTNGLTTARSSLLPCSKGRKTSRIPPLRLQGSFPPPQFLHTEAMGQAGQQRSRQKSLAARDRLDRCWSGKPSNMELYPQMMMSQVFRLPPVG